MIYTALIRRQRRTAAPTTFQLLVHSHLYTVINVNPRYLVNENKTHISKWICSISRPKNSEISQSLNPPTPASSVSLKPFKSQSSTLPPLYVPKTELEVISHTMQTTEDELINHVQLQPILTFNFKEVQGLFPEQMEVLPSGVKESKRKRRRKKRDYGKETILPGNLLHQVTDQVRKMVENGQMESFGATSSSSCKISPKMSDHLDFTESFAKSDLDVDAEEYLTELPFACTDNVLESQPEEDDACLVDVGDLMTGILDRKYEFYQKKELQKAKKKKAQKRKQASGKREENEGEADEKKPRRKPPNYFVAIQMSNQKIHSALKEVQKTILQKDKNISPAFIPIPTLHLTMIVLRLDEEEEMQRAKSALEKCRIQLDTQFKGQPLDIELTGLGHFKKEVLFAMVKPGQEADQLTSIAECVEKCYEEHELYGDGKDFKPHVTVMKLSRAPSLRKKGIRSIASDLYEDYKDTAFGVQRVEGLQLCAMLKQKDETGYYHVEHSVSFGTGTDNTKDLGTEMMQETSVEPIKQLQEEITKHGDYVNGKDTETERKHENCVAVDKQTHEAILQCDTDDKQVVTETGGYFDSSERQLLEKDIGDCQSNFKTENVHQSSETIIK
ncbi:A-kinase anchor protein 7 isoform X2 [Lingula anatina]|uniref:A-kinase anchor protein 7 isoform X2 n=1 Tax=Lingula anatina TaxID=7574 RepID=A0A1S3IHM0_LINAN|nr:A-kinase anchor protein 7 isoform X2 [Lingula anatina]|eukprot:XP_013396984.1 A-kinase anchor protein 7 isoform X2 [Lingula anatina]